MVPVKKSCPVPTGRSLFSSFNKRFHALLYKHTHTHRAELFSMLTTFSYVRRSVLNFTSTLIRHICFTGVKLSVILCLISCCSLRLEELLSSLNYHNYMRCVWFSSFFPPNWANICIYYHVLVFCFFSCLVFLCVCVCLFVCFFIFRCANYPQLIFKEASFSSIPDLSSPSSSIRHAAFPFPFLLEFPPN